MTLWLRSKHWPWLLTAFAFVLGLAQILGGLSLSVPTLFAGGSNVVFLRTYLPLAWAAAIADSFAGRTLGVESRPTSLAAIPVSRLGLLDAALFTATSVAAAGLYAATSPIAASGASAVLILSGVSCVVTLRQGPSRAILLSTMLMLLTSFYPRTGWGARFVHVFQPDGQQQWALGWGVLITALAACMLAGGQARTPPRPDR